MSRTVRKGVPDYSDEYYNKDFSEKTKYLTKKLRRDKKSSFKSPKWFKKLNRRKFRAKCKNAQIKRRELPLEKRTNDWDWN